MKLPRVRFTVRRMMAVVAIAGAGLGLHRWVGSVRERAVYFDFVARSYGQEARDHGFFTQFYRQIIDSRPLEALRSTGYQDAPLFSNDWGGRLTVARQDESDVNAVLRRDPDEGRDIARLESLEARERARSAYFSLLAEKYRHAARYPWLPIEADPPPPE